MSNDFSERNYCFACQRHLLPKDEAKSRLFQHQPPAPYVTGEADDGDYVYDDATGSIIGKICRDDTPGEASRARVEAMLKKQRDDEAGRINERNREARLKGEEAQFERLVKQLRGDE